MTTQWSGYELAPPPYAGEFDAESPFAAVDTSTESPAYPASQEWESRSDQAFEQSYGHPSTIASFAEAGSLPLAHESPEQTSVRQAIAGGTSDIDKLTNLVFFARHPERNGRGLASSEPGFAALAAEWTTIRDTIVGPLMAARPARGTTTDLWVEGAERLANPKSGGGSYVGAPWRFVFHTIEGEPSAEAFRALAASHANPPQLWAMPTANLVLQTIPLNRSGYALARPGSIQTNRNNAIQVEMWGFAAKMVNATPEMRGWLAERVLGPVAKLVPINLDRVRPSGPGEPCYGKTSPCRMSPQEWQSFDGVCGHKDVPDNDHWDPGALDLADVATRARTVVGGTSYIRRERPQSDHDGPHFEAERDDEAPWQYQEQDGSYLMTEMAPYYEGYDARPGASPWGEFDQLTPLPAPVAPTTFVPPPPPKPPLPGPVPISRLCCLLDSKSLKGTETMGGYSLVGGLNSGKPGTVYTGKAGFVDLGHLFSVVDVTAYAYQQIHAARAAAGTKVRTANGEATLTSAGSTTEWLELARSIAYDDALGYEIATYWGLHGQQPGNLNSSFSPEDLCSNYLGTVVAQRAIMAGAQPATAMSFPAQVDHEVRALLVSLDAQSEAETKKAFAKIVERWVTKANIFGKFGPDYLERRNFTRTPWPAGHPRDSPTPAFVLAPFALTSGYVYRHSTGLTNGEFYAKMALIRLDAQKKFGPKYDQPN